MKRSDFNFDLPTELIAQHPPERRVDSRLMWLEDRDSFPITPFPELCEAFTGNEILVLNDTRVVPARFFGRKPTGGAVEVFFVCRLGGNRFKAMLKGKRLKPELEIALECAKIRLVKQLDGGVFECDFFSEYELWDWLEQFGETPLPPYIKRTPTAVDAIRYQTTYARHRGAVAAPTAGLHFTPSLLDALRDKGVTVASITLHVGLGTFMPMRVEDLDEHIMHREQFFVPESTRHLLKSGRPIVAVGTTVVRALESWVRAPNETSTALFIRPGFEFKVIDGLITNFHLPESTLLMMISAFYGFERTMSAYERAVSEKMRFFSYGDAMVIRRKEGRWT